MDKQSECELGTRINTGGSASEAMLVDSTVSTSAHMSTRTLTSDSSGGGLQLSDCPFRSPPSSADAHSSDSTFSLISTPSTASSSHRRKHLTADSTEEGGASAGLILVSHYSDITSYHLYDQEVDPWSIRVSIVVR